MKPTTARKFQALAEAVKQYRERGWIPIPLSGKNPSINGAGWQKRTYDDADFEGEGVNLGIFLGERSGGLTDIDLDSPEARKIAPFFLPDTQAVFGRDQVGQSHLLYLTDARLPTLKFLDPISKEVIAEYRDGTMEKGFQTMFPPSIHPDTGETLRWFRDGEPAKVDAFDLLKRFKHLVAASLLSAYWPGEGARHDAALALSGGLFRMGCGEEEVRSFIQALAFATDDEEARNRLDGVISTANRIDAGKEATGWPRLQVLLRGDGRKIVSTVRDCLGPKECNLENDAADAEAIIRSLQDKKDSSELTDLISKAVDIIAATGDPLKRELLEAQLIAAAKSMIAPNTIKKLLRLSRDREEKKTEELRDQAEEAAFRAQPPVDGVELAEDLLSYYRTYVRIGEDEYVEHVIWTLHCHAFGAFTRTPYPHITSPTVDCGKTQLLEVTELVVPRPVLASDSSAAVLPRTIEDEQPTLLIDEFDQTQEGDKDLLNAVMKTLASGYKKSGKRIVLVPDGRGGWYRKSFSTFCPKIIAGIGPLPARIKSRSIPINMERLAHGEHVSDPDEWVIEPQAARLKARAETWAAQHFEELTRARPDSPPSLRNRQREIVRPLLAVADAIGGVWPERIREAVVRLFARRDQAPTEDIKAELLADIKEVFHSGKKDRIPSRDLVAALVRMEDRPWANFGKTQKGLNQNQLAWLLKDFKIYPTTMRLDDGRRLKGYKRKWFKPVWERYLPKKGISRKPRRGNQAVTPGQPASTQEKTHFSNRDSVTDEKHGEPMSTHDCHGVTDKNLHGDGVRGFEEEQ